MRQSLACEHTPAFGGLPEQGEAEAAIWLRLPLLLGFVCHQAAAAGLSRILMAARAVICLILAAADF
jgi:hypothetical protein